MAVSVLKFVLDLRSHFNSSSYAFALKQSNHNEPMTVQCCPRHESSNRATAVASGMYLKCWTTSLKVKYAIEQARLQIGFHRIIISSSHLKPMKCRGVYIKLPYFSGKKPSKIDIETTSQTAIAPPFGQALGTLHPPPSTSQTEFRSSAPTAIGGSVPAQTPPQH